MKKLSFLAVVAATLGLGACNSIFGVDVSDQKSVDKFLPSRLEKFIDPQSTIYKIDLGTSSSEFTFVMEIATVEFLAPGATEVQGLSIDMFGNQKPREKTITNIPQFDAQAGKMVAKHYTPENGIKLCDIDFSKVSAIVSSAKEITKTNGYTADGIGLFTISFDGNPANTEYKLSTQSNMGTELGQKNGRAAMVTEYMELHFTANAEGNVTLDE